MKLQYTFTVDDDYDELLEESLDNNLNIAMSGTVEVMNELLLSPDVKFLLGRNNTICLVDVASDEVLKTIAQDEIMRIAKDIGINQSLAIH